MENMKKNEKCFIGMPTCGNVYESTKSCFIACPSDKEYSLELNIMTNIIETNGYECHIALQKTDPANFVFCTKICSKIIQSQFCIVLLDNSFNEDGKEIPNPNVHLEYGMMLCQNKYIIPLQEENRKLPFNISELDTIKYTKSNFPKKVNEAVENAIKKFNKTESLIKSQEIDILTFYNISGFTLCDINDAFLNYLYKLGYHLGFYLLEKNNNYKYVGPFKFEDPKKIILNTKLLVENLISAYENSISSRDEETDITDFDYLIKNISIDLIIPPSYDKKDIDDKIKITINDKHKYPIELFCEADIEKKIKEEYSKIGNVKRI